MKKTSKRCHRYTPDSLYYPSSGVDGTPVKYLGGLVHSFIYVDYGFEYDRVKDSLYDERKKFKGYHIISFENLDKEYLIPDGWSPIFPEKSDGNPEKHIKHIRKPYAVLVVHERDKSYGDEHGPERFSILYICGDGVATYQALYHGNGCAPAAVTIIQPGCGFGNNWTDYADPAKYFTVSIFILKTVRLSNLCMEGMR
jgi:hypothetical protein